MTVLWACSRESEISEADVLIKVHAFCSETKSYLSDGHHKWITGDLLRVLSDDGTSVKSEACDKVYSSYDFTVSQWLSDKNPLYAVYCGQQNISFEPEAQGKVVTARLENVQKITHKESFGKVSNLAAGVLERQEDGNYMVHMKNVCGLLKFSFSKYDDIMTVMIQDMDTAPVAGNVEICFDEDACPYVSRVVKGENVLNISAYGKTNSLGNTDICELPKGRNYYACILPGKYRLKITLVRNNGERLVHELKEEVEIERCDFVDIGNIDEYAGLLGEGTLSNEPYHEYDSSDGLPMHIDFSRVGYHWGEDELPVLPVAATLAAPADGSDMTQAIQDALDNTSGGAVLLKAGTYNVSGELYFRHSNVVLRGEGENTVIFAKGNSNLNTSGDERNLINMGENVSLTYGQSSDIIENAPAGQLWVRVADASSFKVTEDVALCRPATAEWISDLRMDQIPQNEENKVKQWVPSAYTLYSSRKVVRINADTVFLDNPVVMSLNDIYGRENRGQLCKVSCSRIRECGIEDLKLVSEFDDSEKDADGNHIDEDHCWSAIRVRAAEHCWVRNVSAAYFGYTTVNLIEGARYITVADCISSHPVSELIGSRRYAFHISGGELCLISRCRAEEDRHGFVTGPKVSGPNVFASCEMVKAFSDVGPHQRWAMGALYDNQVTDGLLAVQDGCNNGSGHGWRGTNFILWNCTAGQIVCQSPWVTGLNWCVGCIGTKAPGRRKDRPDGEWISHGTPVCPSSLYEWQLLSRLENGIILTPLLL